VGNFSEFPLLIYQDLADETWLKQIWIQCQQAGIQPQITIMDFALQHKKDIELMHLFS